MVTEPRPADSWPEHPYPGNWPAHSYVVDTEAMVHRVRVNRSGPSGWAVSSAEGVVDLDEWLVAAGRPPLRERRPVLSFGSNRCPAKVARQGGPMLNLACTTSGLAAVWTHGTRGDGQVVATLVGAPGARSDDVVSLCTDEEMALLDQVEGRGTGYDLVELDPDQVRLEDGSNPARVAAYVGLGRHRWPVAGDDGHPVALTAMSQEEIAAWRATGPGHWEHDPAHPYRPLGGRSPI